MIYRQFNKCLSVKLRLVTFVTIIVSFSWCKLREQKAVTAPNIGSRKSVSGYRSSTNADEKKSVPALKKSMDPYCRDRCLLARCELEVCWTTAGHQGCRTTMETRPWSDQHWAHLLHEPLAEGRADPLPGVDPAVDPHRLLLRTAPLPYLTGHQHTVTQNTPFSA